jgi:hypothetical protein
MLISSPIFFFRLALKHSLAEIFDKFALGQIVESKEFLKEQNSSIANFKKR